MTQVAHLVNLSGIIRTPLSESQCPQPADTGNIGSRFEEATVMNNGRERRLLLLPPRQAGIASAERQ